MQGLSQKQFLVSYLIDSLECCICQTDLYKCTCNNSTSSRTRGNLFLNPTSKEIEKSLRNARKANRITNLITPGSKVTSQAGNPNFVKHNYHFKWWTQNCNWKYQKVHNYEISKPGQQNLIIWFRFSHIRNFKFEIYPSAWPFGVFKILKNPLIQNLFPMHWHKK